MILKILHITNHSGTILNANQVASYINQYQYQYQNKQNCEAQNTDLPLEIEITTHPWTHSYYINKSQANDIFKSFRDKLANYDMLLFTDTPMYARPFLQHLEEHQCGIIMYITNRFDWGITGFDDPEYYSLYHNASLESRVWFIADNRYDLYYAQYRAGIKFTVLDCVRLTPFCIEDINLNSIETSSVSSNESSNANQNAMKFFIQNRGTHISSYNHILDRSGIRYDVFDANNRYRDKAHIAEYLGVFHLPYQVNIQSLMENLGYGIIHYIPSKAFFCKLIRLTGWYYWEERIRSDELLEKSIELAEWYSPDLAHCFIYFDSWDDLVILYNQAIDKENVKYQMELLEKRKSILATVRNYNSKNIEHWQNIFREFISLRPTIVTMFYNVRKMDGDISDYHRREAAFYQLASDFILKLRIPLFICMEPDNHELAELVMKVRESLGIGHLVYIHRERFEDTFFYKYMSKIEDLQKTYKIYNGNPRHETPRYITLNNNKFHFLECAVNLNKFGSGRYIWMDMGISHVAQKPLHILQWQYKIPAKIKQLCINPYLEPDPPQDIFHNIFHHTAGGLFTGSRENMLKYVELYKSRLESILAEGWYQIDEAIMSLVQRENRELFTFYYGDYEGIIANYHWPDLSMNLIMEGARKTIMYNRLDETFALMIYLRPYFQIECNQYSWHFLQYIEYNIICDWYGTARDKEDGNGLLLDDVIELINKKLQMGDGNTKSLLERNKDKLSRYSNLDKLLLPL